MKDCGVSDMVSFFRLAHDPGHDRFGRRFLSLFSEGVSVCFFPVQRRSSVGCRVKPETVGQGNAALTACCHNHNNRRPGGLDPNFLQWTRFLPVLIGQPVYLETVANGGRHIGFSSFNLSHFNIFPLGVYETIEPADGIIGFAILVEISIGKPVTDLPLTSRSSTYRQRSPPILKICCFHR